LLISKAHVWGERTIFLDRDGTIVEDVGYLTSLSDLKVLEGAIEGIRLLQDHFLILLVTNQSAVARGLMDLNDLTGIHQTLADLLQEKGAGLDAIYSCPHLPETHCDCRKPQPGMILRARGEFDIDLDHSLLIGDKISDIIAGQRAKIPVTILVKSPKTDMTNLQNVHHTRMVDNLFEASQYVLNDQHLRD
jgi:D-glycero-D-manno-heptose 1,7-bisphosphate phosphatase